MRKWALTTAVVVAAGAAATAGAASTASTTCAFGQLRITRSSAQAATGHRSIVLRFKNKGQACTLNGYPGVDALSGKLKRVASAKRTLAGFMGGFTHGTKPPVVHLATGHSASAVLEWTGVGGGGCFRARYFLVTPPGGTRSDRFAPPILKLEPVCHLQIHPVVRGTSGQG